jgi:hypothetical protein
VANKKRIDDGKVFSGFFYGLLVGGVVALFKGPRVNLKRTREQLADAGGTIRGKLEAVTPSDPVSESIAEGKEAARRRRSELGMDG